MRVGSYQYNSCLAYRVTARASHRPLYGLACMFLLRPRCVFSFGSLAQQICARFRVLMLLHCLLLLLLWLPVASGMLHHSSRGRRKPKDKAKELQPGKSLKGFAALNMSLCVCVFVQPIYMHTIHTNTDTNTTTTNASTNPSRPNYRDYANRAGRTTTVKRTILRTKSTRWAGTGINPTD